MAVFISSFYSFFCGSRSVLLSIVCILYLFAGCHSTPRATSQVKWSIYKGDESSSSYSALDQININNVSQLRVAWTFHPQDAPSGRNYYGKDECNPIIIDNVLYATSGRHLVYALDAGTGQKIWSFDPYEGEEGRGANRGVTYWENGNDRRILFTAGDHLYALNAEKGTLIPSFGDSGKVSLNTGLGIDPDEVSVRASSPGMVYKDLLIMGSQLSELYGAAPGYIRAYNIRSGKLTWTFHTIPKPGEPGYETWPKDAWKYIGGVNNWTGMSLDRKRGWVFLPLGSPAYDYYGGNRIGKNLYGNCLLVLDAETGEHVWHYQTVHHDLWDYDLPSPPNLVTVSRDGEKIDAVAQLTKTGFLFLLDRETGEPLFPVEERPVPNSYLPGEEAWPTQPFPVKPEPYVRQKVTAENITDRSPEVHKAVMNQLNSLRHEGLFTPPDSNGTLNSPGTRGGAEWGGGAYDPETGVLYFNANEWPEIVTLRRQKNIEEHSADQQTVYERGKAFYMNNCSVCHGSDRRGQEHVIPSLVNIKERMTKKEVLERIEKGGGRMPSFASILNKQEEEQIVAYLFGIQKGQLSAQEMQDQRARSVDTTAHYTNITAFKHFEGPQGRPALKPPWGTINAINLNTGEYEWRRPLGNRPELQQKGAPPTGIGSWGGPIVTAGGLIFTGGAGDRKFRAFEKKTGELVWETELPGAGYAIPATYMSKGQQFIVISISGTREQPGGAIMAFALP